MDSNINLIEVFCSVQGESSLTGLPTTFIRLAACNLRCTWCDTPYSFVRGTPTPMSEILQKANDFGAPYVCITGGEPLLQSNVYSLMEKLCDLGKTVSLETGGSLSIEKVDARVTVVLDVKCPGSNMSDKNDWNNIKLLKSSDEVKFVIADRRDYDYSVEICKKYGLLDKGGGILFSPVHDVLDPKELVTWILRDKLPVRLNLQIHKFIWGANVKGV